MRIVRKLQAIAAILLVLLPTVAAAGTVTGAIQNPSGGGLPNATLTFQLTQPAVVSGTASVVTSPAFCNTDALGNVVGEPNPLALPIGTPNLASGTLPNTTYYFRITIKDSTGQTAPSPESIVALGGVGAMVITAPTKQPPNATGYNVYMSTSSGTETLQGTVTGTPGTWANYSQSVPLVSGSALPGSNTTQCNLRFNDELQPSFVCYNVGLVNQNGTALPGYPQFWYLSGGSGGTVNVGAGTPQSNVCNGQGVSYPQSILAQPAAGGLQSIGGPVSIAGFLNSCISNGVYIAGSTCYSTVQSAITAACNVGGGTVWVPPGTYPQNSQFTLCADLTIVGAGQATCDSLSAPTTITTTITSGDLFNLSILNHVYVRGMCLKNIGAGGGNAIHVNGGLRSTFEDLYISGPWANGIYLTPNVGNASTIWNTFRRIHHTGYQTGAAMVLIDALNTTSQVINNNRFELMTGSGGATGFGLKVQATGGDCPGSNVFINENWFSGGQDSTSLGGGTGVSADNCTFRDLWMDTQTIEGNNLSISIGTGNTGFTCLACEISANTTNIPTDNSGSAGRTFITGNIGGASQIFSVDAAGNLRVNAICVGSVGCNGLNTISVASGSSILASGGTIQIWNSTGTQFQKGITNSGTGLKHGRVTTGSIGSTTHADVTLNWAGTAFADTNYTVTGCVVTETTVAAGTQSLVVERIHTKNTGSIIASVFNGTGGALTGTLECSAMHD